MLMFFIRVVFMPATAVFATSTILYLAGVPPMTNRRIDCGLWVFFYIAAGLCEYALLIARNRRRRRLQLEQEPGGDRSMVALPREPAVGLGRREAVAAGLPVYKYEKVGGREADECPVCLAEILPREVVKQLPACMHLFHDLCIDEWLWSHRTCPVCRYQVDASDVPAEDVAARAMQSV